jgi:hypothetical protein
MFICALQQLLTRLSFNHILEVELARLDWGALPPKRQLNPAAALPPRRDAH